MKSSQWNVSVGGKEYTISRDDDGYQVNGRRADFQVLQSEGNLVRILSSKRTANVFLRQIEENLYEIWIQHHVFQVAVEDSRLRLLKLVSSASGASTKMSTVKAPMPGLITKIAVHEGDEVVPGTRLVVLEAMKMENELKSQMKGKVKRIDVTPRTTVEKGQPLMIIESI